MPKDTKDTKKFKAVTEELVPEAAVPETTKTSSEKISEIEPKEEEKPRIAVRETNNIDFDSKKKEKSAFLKIFLVTFFATLLAFLLAGGIYVYLTSKNSFSNKIVVSSPTPESTETLKPTPTPLANVDISTLKISVLNGNGGIGVASALKAIVEKQGFKVTNLANADNFNFTDTLIQAKTSVSDDTVTKLKASLDPSYSVKIGDQLDSSSSFDIVITVGSK